MNSYYTDVPVRGAFCPRTVWAIGALLINLIMAGDESNRCFCSIELPLNISFSFSLLSFLSMFFYILFSFLSIYYFSCSLLYHTYCLALRFIFSVFYRFSFLCIIVSILCIVSAPVFSTRFFAKGFRSL